MFEEFEVIPAVDIEDGRVVQLVGGERHSGTEYGDPVTAATRWVEAGARTLHLVDLDGAFDGERANATAVERIVETVEIPIQVGGGIRTPEDARSLLDAGVERVILGTAALENPELVSEVSETHPGRVVVSLDASGGEVVISGWTETTGIDPATAARDYEDRGAAGILFTDVDVEGRLAGVREEEVRRVAEAVSVPVVASGGVGSLEDVRTLRAAGAGAVVVGTALYEGRFTLREACAAVADD